MGLDCTHFYCGVKHIVTFSQINCPLLSIISAKMAALPALLGNATEAAQRNNFDENLKRHTMAFASVIGGLGLLTANPEYVQHIFDGFSDAYGFWVSDDREKEYRL